MALSSLREMRDIIAEAVRLRIEERIQIADSVQVIKSAEQLERAPNQAISIYVTPTSSVEVPARFAPLRRGFGTVREFQKGAMFTIRIQVPMGITYGAQNSDSRDFLMDLLSDLCGWLIQNKFAEQRTGRNAKFFTPIQDTINWSLADLSAQDWEQGEVTFAMMVTLGEGITPNPTGDPILPDNWVFDKVIFSDAPDGGEPTLEGVSTP